MIASRSHLALLLALAGASATAGERHDLPPIDLARVLAEDRAGAAADLPLRVGVAVAVGLSPQDAGTWEERADGSRVWRLQVSSSGARWLVLSFDRFRLEPGASVSIFDGRGRPALGPLTGTAERALWLPPLAGDTALVELHWPARLRGRSPDLRLGSVSHGFRGIWGLAEQDADVAVAAAESGCNVDVNCPAGDDWQDEKRGVVEMLIAGSRICSASLINTTAQDCRPYVLTARHCLHTQADAEATLFRFSYERSLCENGEAPTHHVQQGASVLASYSGSDMTLLELATAPPEELAPYFNGWSRLGAPEASWTIHHPGGGPKKISHDADPPGNGGDPGWGETHWRVHDWEEGTTEPGSSGAPLFDPAGRVIGQLHGGEASCDLRSWDEFGKFSVSWKGGATPATRLSDWLDPLRSGVTSIGGLDGGACRRGERSDQRARTQTAIREVRLSRRELAR